MSYRKFYKAYYRQLEGKKIVSAGVTQEGFPYMELDSGERIEVSRGGLTVKKRDLINLLNRAAAALETPNDLTQEEKDFLVEDLVVAAKNLENEKD